MIIRKAEISDLEEITYIFNQAILSKNATGYLNPFTKEERLNWFYEHNNKYPIIVAENEKKVVGWLSLSPYRKDREVFNRTVEISYFIENSMQGRGIGSLLLDYGIQIAKNLNYKVIIAILFHTNIASIKLLEKFNFEKWAFIEDVGEIEGNLVHHLFYGKKI